MKRTAMSHRAASAFRVKSPSQSRKAGRRRQCAAILTLAASTAGGVAGSFSAKADSLKASNTLALNDPNSWTNLTVPGASDLAIWDSTVLGTNTTVLGADLSWRGIQILNPGGLVTINAGNTLTLGTSGIDMSQATQNLTLNNALLLAAAQNWSVATGRTLTLGTGGIGSGGSVATLYGGGVYNFNGVISGTGGGITMNGTGSGTFSAINTGNVTYAVNNGTITFDENAVANGSQVITAGSTLSLGGGTAIVRGKASTTDVNTTGTLSINAGGSTLQLFRGSSGRIVQTYSNFTRATGGSLDFIQGSGDSGANTERPRLSTAANLNGVVPWFTYKTNDWLVAAGTNTDSSVYASYTNSTGSALGTSLQNVTTAADTTLASGATINTLRFNENANRTITISSGTLSIGAGGLLVTSAVSGKTDLITGGAIQGGAPTATSRDLLILQNSSTGTLQIDSVIQDNTSATALTKSGVGTLILGSAANTYTGKTFLNGGITQIAGDGSLGTVPGIAVVDSLTFTGGTLRLKPSTPTLLDANRGITLNAKGGTINTNGTTGSYGGIAAGIGGLSKTGLGSFTLTGTNTYTGASTISAGTLALGTGGSLSNTAINVANTGTFAAIPGAGTVTAGTIGAGSAGATLSIVGGGAFSMVDNAIGTFNLRQNDSFLGNGLTTTGAAVLTFEVGSTLGSIDQLSITKGVSIGAGGQIGIAALTGATALASGDYTFLTAASGLGGSVFTLANSTITLGSTVYNLSLTNSTSTSEILSISSQKTAYWQGSVDNQWTTGAPPTSNWRAEAAGTTPVAPPDSDTVVVFTVNSGASNLNTVLGADFSIKGLTFTGTGTTAASSSVTIGGANTLTIGSEGVTAQSGTAAHTLSTAVTLGATQTWTNNSANALTVSGNLAGTSTNALNIAGTGTIILSGTANTFAGAINVNGGVLQLGSTLAAANNTVTVPLNDSLRFTPGLGAATLGGLAGAGSIALADTGAAAIALSIGNNNASTTYSGVFSGAGSLTKIGTGTLILSSTANTYSGITSVNGGTLQIAAEGTLGSAPGSPIANALSFDGGGILRFGSAITINTNRGITLNGTGGGIDTNGNATNYAGVITGSGNLIKNGAGNLTLSGVNDFNGSTTINGGAIVIPAATAISNTSAINVNTSNGLVLGDTVSLVAPLNIGGGIASEFADVPTGTGTLSGNISVVSGQYRAGTSGGTLVLTGSAGTLNTFNFVTRGKVTYAGNASFNAGTANFSFGRSASALNLVFRDNAVIASGSADIGGGANSAGEAVTVTIQDSATVTVAGNFDINNINNATGAGTLNLNGGTLTVGAFTKTRTGATQTGTINFNGGTLKPSASSTTFMAPFAAYSANVLSGGAKINTSGFDITITQPLVDGGGGGGLTKTGSGTLRLNGTNTYTGTTAVNEGTLGGTGTIAGPVTVAANASLAPGNSIGTINTGALTLSANSTLAIEVDFNNDLSSATTPTADRVRVAGAVADNITGANVQFTFLNIGDPAGGPLGSPKTLVLIQNLDDAATVTGTFADNPGFYTFSTNYNAETSTPGTGNDVAVTFSAVPEPTSVGLLGLAGAGLLGRRRRAVKTA